MDNPKTNPSVIVMMSSFNGEKYIKEQIESVLAQENVNVDLFIRDDSSKDGTVSIIDQYAESKKCHIIKGDNIGAAASFLELVFSVPESEYYAFCDQDDIWDKDKLSIAIDRIKDANGPALYHGLAGKVDENLKPLKNRPYTPRQTFGAALLSSATGCTMVFNNSLMNIIRKYHPAFVSMHDAWVYRVAYAFDSYVVYDNLSHMKYRQHGNNVSGGDMSVYKRVARQIQVNRGLRLKTANELYAGYYNNLPEKNRTTLYDFVNYPLSISSKTKVLFSREYDTNKIKTTLQYKLLFLFNLI